MANICIHTYVYICINTVVSVLSEVTESHMVNFFFVKVKYAKYQTFLHVVFVSHTHLSGKYHMMLPYYLSEHYEKTAIS